MKEKPICCLCGKECENEYGNNPYPIDKDKTHRCCNKCNLEKVIPRRIQDTYIHKK